MTGEPIKPLDESKPAEVNKDLLLPGLANLKSEPVSVDEVNNASRFAPTNPPVAESGRVQDNNLTNQDGQPLENSPLTTGFTGVTGDNFTKDGEVATGVPKNSDQAMPQHEKFKAVVDKVSGNTVVVRNKTAEVETVELQRLMKIAHDSLGDAQISDISTGHPYWNLQEQARRYGKEHGLI